MVLLPPFSGRMTGLCMRSHRAKDSCPRASTVFTLTARLRFDERLMSFLDDIHAKSSPNRSVTVFTAIQEELQRAIQVHDG